MREEEFGVVPAVNRMALGSVAKHAPAGSGRIDKSASADELQRPDHE
jgi:hypothetical protein